MQASYDKRRSASSGAWLDRLVITHAGMLTREQCPRQTPAYQQGPSQIMQTDLSYDDLCGGWVAMRERASPESSRQPHHPLLEFHGARRVEHSHVAWLRQQPPNNALPDLNLSHFRGSFPRGLYGS